MTITRSAMWGDVNPELVSEWIPRSKFHSFRIAIQDIRTDNSRAAYLTMSVFQVKKARTTLYDFFEKHAVAGFKRIRGMERYGVDRYSRVMNLRKRRILTPVITTDGYRAVTLVDKDGIRKPIRVHRLVANAYIPNPEGKPVVNHKDGNKANNKLWNLEWTTVQENTHHAINTGLKPSQSSMISESVIKAVLVGEDCNRETATIHNLPLSAVHDIRQLASLRYQQLAEQLKDYKKIDDARRKVCIKHVDKETMMLVLYSPECSRTIARELGLASATVDRIRNGKTKAALELMDDMYNDVQADRVKKCKRTLTDELIKHILYSPLCMKEIHRETDVLTTTIQQIRSGTIDRYRKFMDETYMDVKRKRDARCVVTLTDDQIIAVLKDPRCNPVVSKDLGIKLQTVASIRKGKTKKYAIHMWDGYEEFDAERSTRCSQTYTDEFLKNIITSPKCTGVIAKEFNISIHTVNRIRGLKKKRYQDLAPLGYKTFHEKRRKRCQGRTL